MKVARDREKRPTPIYAPMMWLQSTKS